MGSLFLVGGVVPAASAAPVETEIAAPDVLTAATRPSERTQDDSRPLLTIALLDTLINPFDTIDLRATIAALEKALPQYRWRTLTISAAEAAEHIAQTRPDFLFAPAGFVAEASQGRSFANQRIVTRKTVFARSALKSTGAVFAVRADSDLTSLADLRGLRAGASLPTSLDGWLAASAEIQAAGYDPERFFGSAAFRNNAYPDVVSALLAGRIDVAVIPTCLLETMEAMQLADVAGITVVNEKTDDALACRRSTDLYPDVSLLATGTAPEAAVRDVTIEMLRLPAVGNAEWRTNVSHSAVLDLMRELRTGPYAYLRDMSPSALFRRYRTEALLAALFVGFLILNELQLHRLVRRRTAELRATLREKERMAEEAARTRLELQGFERRSIVQQMSGMIAHEINGPVGAIRTYATILKLEGGAAPQEDGASDPQLELRREALEGIDREAVRIADIVASVRRYARSRTNEYGPVSLSAALRRSLLALRSERPEADEAVVRLTVPGRDERACVRGNALELEILFLNLLRNAWRAAYVPGARSSRRRAAAITCTLCALEAKDESSPAPAAAAAHVPRWRVTIENPGTLTERELADLNDASAGIRRRIREAEGRLNDAENHAETDDGLGLGLTICRGIAENHGARLRFECNSGIVRTIFEIDAASAFDNSQSET